jgi:hypothetical protein
MGASSTPAVGGWVVVTSSWAVVVVSPAVVVGASAAVVVVVASTVVVVGATVVVVGGSTVVVGATEMSGAGGNSVVVGAVVGTGGGGVAGGPEGLGVVAGVVARGAAAVVGAWAARDTPAGGSGGTVVLVDDPGLALEGATDGGSAGNGGLVVSAGSCWTAEGARGVLGTSAADATRAASTANVSPKATSMRRQGSWCSARWRGFRGGMTCPRRRILRIVRSNGKSASVIMGRRGQAPRRRGRG